MVRVFVCVDDRATGSLASFHANLHSCARLVSTRDRLLSELESKRYDKAVIGQVSPGCFFFLVRCLLIQLRVLFSLPTHLLS